jgi:hypothetical protein
MLELKRNSPERTKPINIIVSIAMIPIFTNKITIIQKGIQIIVAHIIPENGIKNTPFLITIGSFINTTKYYLSIIIFRNKYS